MDKIQYVGERLWAGELGQWLTYISFSTALLSTVAYTLGARKKELTEQQSLKTLGRWSFGLHGLSVFGIIGLLIYMMLARFYEYEYVWAHTSNQLPFKYIFSAFWEGQEGSFLLWMFWNVVLGFLLMRTAKTWEMPVMATFALMQVLLGSMLLGFYYGNDARIGSNPFVLLRDMNFSPRFNEANYLNGLEGRGLNPLLQNYWMTIHPPTLFLGFASTLVPFAYAVAGLWSGRHKEWLAAALPWALFSGAILGAGILMGGAWAYEALSFGGYWAWDPVENASLVPWLTLVAGIHTALVAKTTGYSIKSTYLFFIITFVLIVYSTFLTRSGILGETSAHAFTEMGLEWQLVIFIAVSLLWGLVPYFWQRKTIPTKEPEESGYSKEFWLFVGALVLLFSGILITATTSIPVFNAIVKGLGLSGSIPKIAPPEDVVAHHNRFQLWIGVLIGFLSGLAQFFRYHQTEFSGQYKGFVLKHLGISFGLAAILTPLIIWPTGIQAWQYWLLVGSGIFAVLSNADYVWSVLRNKLKLAGSAFAHVGFGALMVGAVFSGALKDPISEGFTSVDDALQGLTKQTNKNVLVVRNTPTKIKGGYEVTYNETWSEGNAQFFALHFIQRDPQGNLLDSFTTYPNVLREIQPSGQPKFQASNPDTKHHLSKDIFTLAVPNWAFQDPEAEQRKRDSLEQTWKLHTIAVGDTFFTQKQFVVLRGVETKVPPIQGYEPQEGDIAVALKLEAHRIVSEDSVQVTAAMPLYYIRGNKPADVSAVLHEQSLTLRFTRIFPNENKFQVAVLEYAPEREYVVVQALVFPGINLVWLGASLMTLGLTIAMALRIKEKWKIEQEEEQVA